MDEDRSQNPGIVDTLLSPLRIPQRVMGDVEEIAASLQAFQRDAKRHLAAVDENSAQLVIAVGALQAPLDRLDARVAEIETMEEAVTIRIEAVQHDLNLRMLAVEEEVRAMRSPIEQMARDVQSVVRLLPEPGDGPFTRLKDTLTSS